MSFLAVIITFCISFLLFYRSSPTPVTYAVLCWRLNVLTNASDKSKLSRKVLRLARQKIFPLDGNILVETRIEDTFHFLCSRGSKQVQNWTNMEQEPALWTLISLDRVWRWRSKKKHCNFRLFTATFEPRHENKNCSACPEDQLELF